MRNAEEGQKRIFSALNIVLLCACLLSVGFASFFVYDIVLQAREAEENVPVLEIETEPQTEAFIEKPTMQLYVSDKVSFLAHVNVDGKDYTFPFEVGENATVQTLLDKAGIQLSENDYIDKYSRSTPLFEDIYVEVGRVTYEYVTTKENIDYETIVYPVSYRLYRLAYKGYYDKANKAEFGERAGQYGVKETTTRVKYVNGIKRSSTKVSEKITKQPVSAIVYKDVNYMFDRGDGVPKDYLAKSTTLQCTSYYRTSVGGKTTYSKAKCEVGHVAADYRWYPIGTKLYIVLPDGFVYGYCTVEDIGGSVKGNIIDLFFESEADSIGRARDCTVYVVEWGDISDDPNKRTHGITWRMGVGTTADGRTVSATNEDGSIIGKYDESGALVDKWGYGYRYVD